MGNDDAAPDRPSFGAQLAQWAVLQQGVSAARDSAAAIDKLLTGGGVDPDYLPSSALEPFVSMPHAEIVKAVNDIQPGMMHVSAQTWRQIADAVMFNTMGLNAQVNKTLSEGWDGTTSDAIRSATSAFVNEMTEMHNVTQGVVERIEGAAYGGEVVKGAVPSVPAKPGAPAVPGAENPATVIGFITASSDAEQEARQAMIKYYAPAYVPAGQRVPKYVPPTGPYDGPPSAPVNEPGIPTGPSAVPGEVPGTSTSGNENPDSSNTAADSTTPASTAPPTMPAQETNASPSHGGSTTTNLAQDPAATTAAGFDAGATGNPTHAVPGSSISGGAGTTPGPASPVPGGPGRSVAAPPGAAPIPAGGLSSGVRPAAAASGPHGVPGMGAPAAKGKGEDDKEHKGRRELLVHERNKADLTGGPVITAPPVFGQNPAPREEQRKRSREQDEPRS
ncbi:hypothetical protein [Nocardia nova]|uniref:hypothetical protein n=1 Tax=Nocardia nova TaxID=37330 RepID=UPI0034020F4E